MGFLNKLERKLGKHAIPNLIVYIIAGYGLGYIFTSIDKSLMNLLTLEPYYILRGQVWRTHL